MADNNNEINLKLSVSNIPQSDINKVAGTVDSMVNNLNDKLVVKVNFGSINKNIREVAKGFKEFSNTIKELNSYFSDVSKMTSRAYDTTKKVMNDLGAVNKSVTTDIKNHSMSELQDLSQYSLKLLKQAEATAKKRVSLITAKGEDPSKALDNLYAKSQAVAIKEYQSARDYSDAAHSELFTKLALLKDQHEKRILDIDAKYRKSGLGAYAQTEEQKTNILLTEEKKRQDANSKTAAKDAESSRKAELNKARDITKDKHDAWLYDPKNTEKKNEYVSSAKELSNLRINPSTAEDFEDLKRKEQNIDDYVKKREAGNLKSTASMNSKKESLMADHYKRLAMLSDKHDQDYLKSLNKASWAKLESKGIEPYQTNRVNGNTKSYIEVEREKNQHKLDEVIKARQKTSVDILKNEEKVLREEIAIYKQIAKTNGDHDDVLLSKMNQADKLKTDRLGNPEMLAAKEEANKADMVSIVNARREKSIVILKEELALIKEQISIAKKNGLYESSLLSQPDSSNYLELLEKKYNTEKSIRESRGKFDTDEDDLNRRALIDAEEASFNEKNKKAEMKSYRETHQLRYEELKEKKKYAEKLANIDYAGLEAYRKTSEELAKETARRKGMYNFDKGSEGENFVDKQMANVQIGINNKKAKLDKKFQEAGRAALIKNYADNIRIHNDANRDEVQSYEKKYRDLRLIQMKIDDIRNNETMSPEDKKITEASYNRKISTEIEKIRAKNTKSDASSNKAELLNENNSATQQLEQKKAYWEKVGFNDRNYRKMRIAAAREEADQMAKTMGLGHRETLKLQKQFVSDVEKEYQSAMGHGSSYAQSIMAKIRGLLVFTGFGFVVKQALVAISKAGIEFNDTMAGVRAVTSASNVEFEKLITSARTLAIATRYTANEVAQLQDIYAKLGLSVSSILEASKPTLDLATATGENLAETAESVAVTLNGFQLSADQTTRVVDVMAKSFVESALDLERYREGMKLAAPVANALNMSVEQTTSLFAMLSNIGISGSMAGTGIRNVLSQASSSSSKLSKVLGGTASTWEEFIELLRTANRRGEDFKRTALSDLDLRIKGVVVALAENVEQLDKVAIGYENATDSAKKMADIKLDTAAGDLDVWSNVFNEEKIQMFGMGEKNLRSLIHTATDLTKYLSELAIVVKNLGEGFAVTAAILGTVKAFNMVRSSVVLLTAAFKDAGAAQYAMQIIDGQRTMAMTQAATATTLLGKSAVMAKGAFQALWLTMSQNPLLWGTIAIGGLITTINYLSEAEERAIKRNREYNDSLIELMSEDKLRYEKNAELLKKYIDLRDLPESEKEDGSLNKEREAALLKLLIERYPELAKEVRNVDAVYKSLNKTIDDYNRSLDEAQSFKMEIDIQEAELALKDMKNGWADYIQYVGNLVTPGDLFDPLSDINIPKAFRNMSYTARTSAELYSQGEDADPEKVKRQIEFIEIQKDLANKKLSLPDSQLSRDDKNDVKENIRLLNEYRTELQKILDLSSKKEASRIKIGALDAANDLNRGGSSGVESKLKGLENFLSGLDEKIKMFTGDKEQLQEYLDQIIEKRDAIFNNAKDGESIAGLGIKLNLINQDEFDKLIAQVNSKISQTKYAMMDHFIASSDELLLTKGMGEENYIESVKAEMRSFWIEEKKYESLKGKDRQKHDKLAIDLLYKRRDIETQVMNMGLKDQASINQKVTELFKAELDKRLQGFMGFSGDMEKIAAKMLTLPGMSAGGQLDAYEQEKQKDKKDFEDAQLTYLNNTKKSKTSDGKYTAEARKLRFEQLLREYTDNENLSDLGKSDTSGGKTVTVPLMLQKKTYDRKIREMAEAQILEEEGGSKKKREDKSEQLRPDLISIRKKINEFNQKEQAKEIAELENFYSEKIALVSYGEKAAYAKRTELDKKTAADVARSIDETNSLEALKATAFKSLADKSVSIDGELRQNLIDQSKAGGDKGELARLRLEYKNIESEQKSHNKKIIDLKKQLNGENGAEAQRFAKVAIKMIADEEMQKQQVIKKYADIRAKEIRDMQNSIDQNEYRKQLYSIENERTDGLKKYQQNGSDSASVSSDKLTQRMLVEEKYVLAKRDLQKKATKELMSANDDVLNAALDGYEEERKKFKDMYDQKLITAAQFSYSMRTIDIKEKSSRSEADGNKSDIEVYARLKKIRAMGDKARAEEAKERAKQILDEYELEKSVLSEKIQGIKDYYAADTMLAAESINAISKLKRDGLMTRRSELEENFRNVNSNENSTPEEKLKASTELNDFNFQSKEQEISLLSKEEEVRTKLRDLMADTSLEDIAFQTKLLKLKKELELTEEQYKALLKLRNLQSKEISNANDIKVEGTIGSLIDSYGKAAAAFQKYADTRTAGNPQQSEEMEASHNALIAYGKAAGDTIDVVAGMYSSIRTLGEADTQNQIDKVNRDKEANIAALDDQHEKGMWSKTQYENKKKAINEKALEEERKIKKKQKVWTEIQIIIDTAAGIAKAFAQGGILGFITGGLIAAAGAAQLKAVQQQKFAKGGFTGPGTVRDETGKRVAGVVHQNEVVFEEAITMPNLGGLMEIRRLLQSGVKLRDIVNPKININKVPRLPNLPQHVYATGGFTGNNSALVNASLSSNISAQLLDVVNSIDVLNKNLIEKVMTVNVEAKTIDPIKVHDLSEEGKKSKGYLYDK